MVGNKAKGICGSLAGTLNDGGNAGSTKLIAMVVASEMCDSLLWPDGCWAAGFAFESFFSWIPRRLDSPLSYDLCLSHDICSTDVYLGSSPCLTPGSCSHLWGGDNPFWSQRSYFCCPAVEA
jgi:hypothetical protein